MTSKISEYLPHSLQPKPTFLEHRASKNWQNWKALKNQLTRARGTTKFGKDKGIIRKMLVVCLGVGHKKREKFSYKIQDL